MTMPGTPTQPMYDSLYQGVVVNTNDPTNSGLVQLQIPQILGSSVSAWAEPMQPGITPAVGTSVLVTFLGGNPNAPYYFLGVTSGLIQSVSTGSGTVLNENPFFTGNILPPWTAVNATLDATLPSSAENPPFTYGVLLEAIESTQDMILQDASFPVAANMPYQVSAWIWWPIEAGGTVNLGMVFLDVNGNPITGAFTQSFAIPSTAWVLEQAVVTAPANAVSGYPIVDFVYDGSNALNQAIVEACTVTGSIPGQLITPSSIGTGQINFTATDIGGITVSIQDTAPTNPNLGDLWYDISSGLVLMQYQTTGWQPYQWGSGSLQEGAIVSGLIAAGAIDGMTINGLTINGNTINAADILISATNGGVFVYAQGGGTNAILSSGTSWTCPAGVTTINSIICFGGGGGGSYATSKEGCGGGGGECGIISSGLPAVIPNGTYPILIGSGGAAGTSGSNPGVGGGDTAWGVTYPYTVTHATPAVFTATGSSSLANGMMVIVTATQNGFTAGTEYFMVNVSGSTFNLATTVGGSALASTGSTAGNLAAYYCMANGGNGGTSSTSTITHVNSSSISGSSTSSGTITASIPSSLVQANDVIVAVSISNSATAPVMKDSVNNIAYTRVLNQLDYSPWYVQTFVYQTPAAMASGATVTLTCSGASEGAIAVDIFRGATPNIDQNAQGQDNTAEVTSNPAPALASNATAGALVISAVGADLSTTFSTNLTSGSLGSHVTTGPAVALAYNLGASGSSAYGSTWTLGTAHDTGTQTFSLLPQAGSSAGTGGSGSTAPTHFSGGNGAQGGTGSGGTGSAQWTSHGTFNWTCPANVTSIKALVIGPGGGGGGSPVGSNYAGSGGGGGGSAVGTIAVTPGNTYTIVIGQGGAGGNSSLGSSGWNGVSGYGNSTAFGLTGNLGGGGYGLGYSAVGSGGSAGSGGYAGGAGGYSLSNGPTAPTSGGGGGGSAGSGSAGGQGGSGGFESSPGSGGTAGSGQGGTGGQGGNDGGGSGYTGGSPGAGGGGAGNTSGSAGNGGVGSDGAVYITWGASEPKGGGGGSSAGPAQAGNNGSLEQGGAAVSQGGPGGGKLVGTTWTAAPSAGPGGGGGGNDPDGAAGAGAAGQIIINYGATEPELLFSVCGAATPDPLSNTPCPEGPCLWQNNTMTFVGSAVLDGNATSGSGTTLTDSSQSWTSSQWIGFTVNITGGTGSGLAATITANTATQLTFASIGATLDSTTQYEIVENTHGSVGSPGARQLTIAAPMSKANDAQSTIKMTSAASGVVPDAEFDGTITLDNVAATPAAPTAGIKLFSQANVLLGIAPTGGTFTVDITGGGGGGGGDPGHTSIARRNTASIGGFAASTGVTITIPTGTGVQAYDTFVICVGHNNASSHPTVTVNGNSATWSFSQAGYSGANAFLSVYTYRTTVSIADGASIVTASSTSEVGIAVDIFSGVSSGTLTHSAGLYDSTQLFTQVTPAITAPAAGSLVVMGMGYDDGASIAPESGSPFSAGSTAGAATSGTGNFQVGMGYVTNASGSGTYASGFTSNDNHLAAAVTMSLY